MKHLPLPIIAATALTVFACLFSNELSVQTYSQASQGSTVVEATQTTPPVPQTYKVVRTDAEKADIMKIDLAAVPVQHPRGLGFPKLGAGPRLLNIETGAPSATPPTTHFDQLAPGPDLAVGEVRNFAGISHDETPVPVTPTGKYIVRSAPPDTNGSVGDDYYVQWVNTTLAVYKKSGELVYGPTHGKTVWTDFDQGICENDNDGDPTVQYDKASRRWVLSQFAYTTGERRPSPTYYQCVAVSETANPLGKYRRFRFKYSLFNDYPKMGVWNDGYYMTFNMFNDPKAGAMVCSYDRDVMLGLVTNRKASQQCVQLDNRYFSLMPADIDGKIAPPPNSPNYLVNLDPNNNAVNLWRFKVDWKDSSKSALSGPFPIAGVPTFETPCVGSYRLACIPQPATNQKLESLSDRMMFRFAYRRFADGRESLLFNHLVSVPKNGKDVAAIRWYELRDPSGPPKVYQSGTFAPDEQYRWIGSIAMDGVGNIGMAYSVASETMFPSLYYTGQASDEKVKGRLGSEKLIIQGGGSQTCRMPNGDCNTSCKLANGLCYSDVARWGDYSSLSVDPADDCTLWFTSEYLPTSGAFNWRTRIFSFKFASCK